MGNKYRYYFDIDPDFFPAVDADVIRKNPDLWKKFYPHETFVKLLKDVVSVLTRRQKLNIWVEGAYGTGKSYAVHTLKCLLDANEEDTRCYFETFNLDKDLCNRFVSAKNSGRILTVHRYGSSSINGDNALFLAMQESIEAALREAGIENKAGDAMRQAVIKYLSEEENKQSFGVYVRGSYKELFGGDDVDKIVEHLKEYEEQPLQILLEKVLRVAEERNIKAFTLDDEGMRSWIAEVIHNNNLSALVFIWDEFQEYFDNNRSQLTGFQRLLQASQTEPFCFIPVTHRKDAGFRDNDENRNKILDRFIKPKCAIELPDNMAFRLIAQAMDKKKDENIRNEWKEIASELNSRTKDVRDVMVKDKTINIKDEDLIGVLPIHPYAVLLLKHISTQFNSNQRSMFNFIKNNRGEDKPGFQSFIDAVGPFDENPLLTIDQLWGFFYDEGKDSLSHSVRIVLDNYPRLERTGNLDSGELRVLKAILLMQAMSIVTNEAEQFQANERNLNNAFEGSDLEGGEAVRCAEKLVRDGYLFKKKVKGDQMAYALLTGEMDTGKIEEQKQVFLQKTTSTLVQEGELMGCIELTAPLRLRCIMDYACSSDFDKKARNYINMAADNSQKMYALVTFAANEGEAVLIERKIQDMISANPSTTVVFIDTSRTPLGAKAHNEWAGNKATSAYMAGKDNDSSRQFNTYAGNVLNTWRESINQFRVYTGSMPTGETAVSREALTSLLQIENRRRFPLCLENYNVHDPMWQANMMPAGAECGAAQKLTSTYAKDTRVDGKKMYLLEYCLEQAWGIDEYWKKGPSLQIAKIKIAIEEQIEKAFEERGNISIREIYEKLKEPPYGFMPCNLTAFMIGFLLKEYVLDGKYTWRCEETSDQLTIDKYKEMIGDVIKNDITPNARYRDKLIVTMTEEERCFLNTTATAFRIDKTLCGTLENARERVRSRMTELGFPIWCLTEILDTVKLDTDKEVLVELINLYCGIANNNRSESKKSDSDIAMEIGRLCMAQPQAVSDFTKLLSRDNCTKGMKAYLQKYRGGTLPALAETLNDDGRYVNAVRSKFDADAGLWVWRQATVNQLIDDVMLEYQIMVETSKLFGSTCKTFDDAQKAWTDRCRNMRLCYQAIRDEVGGLGDLLAIMNSSIKSHRLQENQKKELLEQIREQGDAFHQLYGNQLGTFVKVADFYLADLNDADKEKVFTKIEAGTFTADKAEYFNKIEQIVSEYKKTLGAQKLREYWQERTQTESPYQWSQLYRMPILAIMADEDLADCRKVFGTLNAKQADANAIEKAQIYLEKATFWERLDNAEEREQMFRKRIIGDYSTMLTDTDEVKTHLEKYITDPPYYWYGSDVVRRKVAELAQSKYNSGGYQAAFSKIDSMDSERVKQYLKELIKNNMRVGIEIIKDK